MLLLTELLWMKKCRKIKLLLITKLKGTSDVGTTGGEILCFY